MTEKDTKTEQPVAPPAQSDTPKGDAGISSEVKSEVKADAPKAEAPKADAKSEIPETKPETKADKKEADAKTSDGKATDPAAKTDAKAPDQNAPVVLPKILEVQLPSDEVKKPEEPILTVRLRKYFFFARPGVPVFVLQAGQMVEQLSTDKFGEALFKLKPGEYVVVVDDIKHPINITDHATLKI